MQIKTSVVNRLFLAILCLSLLALTPSSAQAEKEEPSLAVVLPLDIYGQFGSTLKLLWNTNGIKAILDIGEGTHESYLNTRFLTANFQWTDDDDRNINFTAYLKRSGNTFALLKTVSVIKTSQEDGSVISTTSTAFYNSDGLNYLTTSNSSDGRSQETTYIYVRINGYYHNSLITRKTYQDLTLTNFSKNFYEWDSTNGHFIREAYVSKYLEEDGFHYYGRLDQVTYQGNRQDSSSWTLVHDGERDLTPQLTLARAAHYIENSPKAWKMVQLSDLGDSRPYNRIEYTKNAANKFIPRYFVTISPGIHKEYIVAGQLDSDPLRSPSDPNDIFFQQDQPWVATSTGQILDFRVSFGQMHFPSTYGYKYGLVFFDWDRQAVAENFPSDDKIKLGRDYKITVNSSGNVILIPQ